MRKRSVSRLEPALRAWVAESLSVAAHPEPGRNPQGLAGVLARRVDRLPPTDRQRIAAKFGPLARAPRSLRDHLGRIPNVDAGVGTGRVVDDVLGSVPGSLDRRASVRFEIVGVECTKTTKEVGPDELYTAAFVGAVGEDAAIDRPLKLGPVHLGNFRNGDEVTFSSPVATSPIAVAEADGFQTFVSVNYCAEVDDGDFFAFVDEVYATLLAQGTVPVVGQSFRYIERIQAVGLLAIGVGGTIVFPPAGIPVLVAIVIYLIAQEVQFWRADELFPVWVDTLEIAVNAGNPPAPQVTPVRSQSLIGFGADYGVKTRWRIL